VWAIDGPWWDRSMTVSAVPQAAESPAGAAAGGREYDDLARGFARIAVKAGAVVMRVYNAGAKMRLKADASPVCEADEMAEALILDELSRFVPNLPVLAEEAAARGEKPSLDGRFVLVDPVDGTKEFLGRNGEFTVNIALVDHGVPRAGAIYAPALNKLWFGGETAFKCLVEPGGDPDGGAPIKQLHTREQPQQGLVVVASRSHADPRTEQFLAGLTVLERRSAGSSLKFCLVAEGQADLYPRFGPTMEWDTAAGDAILRAAGGTVLGLDGEPLRYGKRALDFRNEGFMAWGQAAGAARRTSPAARAALDAAS
jgi:3'(2'), 5'-bisphosphate nucleotidase